MIHSNNRFLNLIPDALTALLIAALLGLIALYPLRVNRDAALFLDTGSLILDGKTPYVDFDEINLPLIMVLHAVPVGIGRALNVNPIPLFSLGVALLLIGSAGAIRVLLAREFGRDTPLALRLMPAFLALYTLYLFLIGEYGQREHLFMLLFLPGFVLRWRRWEGDQPIKLLLALIIGGLAGVGAAIKPYFLVIAFAPEAYWIVRAILTNAKTALTTIRRAFIAPEIAGFVGFGVIYAAALLLIAPIRTALFETVLPYASSSYSSYGIGVTPLSLLWRLDTVLLWIGLIAALPLVRRNRSLARALWVLALAAILMFCWQGKGWYYHRIPAILGVSLLLMMVITGAQAFRLLVIDMLYKVLLVVLAYLILTLGGVVNLVEPYPALRDAILAYSQPGDSVLVINSRVDPAYPLLVQTGRRSADRNLTGYPVSADPASDPDLAQYVQSLSQSIPARRPPLILINRELPCYGCAPNGSLWQYLQQIGFIDQYVTPEYDDLGAVEQFEVYVRK